MSLSKGITKVSSIPFEVSNGLILIQAKVNEHEEGTFIFDTGSSDIFINGTARSNGNEAFESLNGAISTESIHIKSIKLGDFKKVGLQAYITDLSGIESYVNKEIYGILNGAYFSPNEVFIDLKNRTLEVSHSFDFKEYSQLYQFRLHDYNDITVVHLPYKDKELRFGLDSGASSHILSKNVLEKFNIQYKVIQSLDLINHSGKTEEIQRIQTGSIFQNLPQINTFLVKELDEFNRHTSARLDGFISVTAIPADFIYINRNKQYCLIGNFE